MEFKSKKEWEAAADKMFADGVSPQEINKTIGTYSGPEGTFTIQQAKSSKRGFTVVDKDKRGKRNQKRKEMEFDQSMGVGDTVEPRSTTDTSLRAELGAGKGEEIHHRISLIQNTPFFDGLPPEDKRRLVTWAEEQGWDLGNRPGNPEIVIPKSQHTNIHGWLRQNEIETQGGRARLKQRFAGMSLNERMSAFRDFMEYVQGGADEYMAETIGEKSISPRHQAAQQRNRNRVYQSNLRAELAGDVGTIPTGPRQGEPMPVNRRTMGEALLRQLQRPKLVTRSGQVRLAPPDPFTPEMDASDESVLSGYEDIKEIYGTGARDLPHHPSVDFPLKGV